MSIGDFLNSSRWKLIQNYIYSWGASIVLIGALFKLEHLQGSGIMLGIGLSIEAIIFFVSAFEPLMETPDWRTVYPQLRTGEEKPKLQEKYDELDKKYSDFFSSTVSGGSIDLGGIPDEQMKNLKDSFDQLSKTASGLKDISKATSATSEYVNNITEASKSISTVVEANNKVATAMNSSVDNLSASVSGTASSIVKAGEEIEKNSTNFTEKLNQTASGLNTTYQNITESLSNSFSGLEKNAETYVGNLDTLNKNIAALNAAYELNLKGTSKIEEAVSGYSKSVDEIGKLLNTSVEETQKFNKNTQEINENIQALNNIYGKMLGALNGKK